VNHAVVVLKCNLCQGQWVRPRGYRPKRMCPSCARVGECKRRAGCFAGGSLPPPSVEHLARVEHYRLCVEAGWRLFEATPGRVTA
jgi:hypothetical protein